MLLECSPPPPTHCPISPQWLFCFVCFFKKEAGFGAPVLRLGSKESTSSAAAAWYLSLDFCSHQLLPLSTHPTHESLNPLLCVVVVVFLQLVCLLVEISGTLLSTHWMPSRHDLIFWAWLKLWAWMEDSWYPFVFVMRRENGYPICSWILCFWADFTLQQAIEYWVQ